MAMLMQKYKLSNGMVSDQAFLKVNILSGNKECMSFMVEVYMSKEASDSKLTPIDEFTVIFVPEVTDTSPNYHKQAYDHLKTLPRFENAIDVLE